MSWALTVSWARRMLRGMPGSARLGIAVICVCMILSLLAPLVAPYGEREVVGPEFSPWSLANLLGTDNLGRDMLSRLIYGARNSIGIALVTTALAFLIGAGAGLSAGTAGGIVDRALAFVCDIIMAVPSLITVLLVLTMLGSSIPVLIAVIALLESTRVFRLARAVSMGIVTQDYFEAARLRGEGFVRLVTREVLPNSEAPLTAEFGLRFCFVFLFISALSFLGLGIQPPAADWGGMVRDNASLITFGDITPLLPAAAIALLTVSVNFIVDWQLQRGAGLKD
ncbi:peptide/nickel transport system permease protein [Rhizobiales bacterium GAS191]|nr:peptide/nickel transport system permease protein [Rhizobiales bacterium GAS191]